MLIKIQSLCPSRTESEIARSGNNGKTEVRHKRLLDLNCYNIVDNDEDKILLHCVN